MTGRDALQAGGSDPARPVETTPFRLVYGYLYVGGGPPGDLPARRAALVTAARRLEFGLGTVFVDYALRPAAERPGWRALLDVVRVLRPTGVLIPNDDHLSPWPPERAALLDEFRALACPVLAVGTAKTTVLVAGRGVRS